MKSLTPEILAMIGPDSDCYKAFCRREALRVLQVWFNDIADHCPNEFHAGGVALAEAYRPEGTS